MIICQDCKQKLKKGTEYVLYKDALVKCRDCFLKNTTLEDYQECDIYSRVVGFHTPTNRWNNGKSAEWKDRKTFDVS